MIPSLFRGRAAPARTRVRVHVCALAIVWSAAGLALLPAGAAFAQTATATPYRYPLPPGWSRAADGDTETLSPADAGGAIQVMIMAPKAAGGDFAAQFASERAALEGFWGLRAPQPAPPQQGQGSLGPYGAYFASYDSDGGPRFMGFLAQVQNQRFAMVVFVAAANDTFNRYAPNVVDVFKGLAVAP